MASSNIKNSSIIIQQEEEEEKQQLHHHHQQQQQQPQFLQNPSFVIPSNSKNSSLFNFQNPNFSDHHQHHHHHHQLPFSMNLPSISSNFLSKDGGGDDLGELDQALFLYLDGQEPSSTTTQDQRQSSGMRPPTLNIFPSQPMHVDSLPIKGNTTLINHGGDSKIKASEPSKELANQRSNGGAIASAPAPTQTTTTTEPHPKPPKRESSKKGLTSSSEQEGPKTPDPKTLRRLAQNREAARKSRLRKKAYVQQLEMSRIKLTQLEQELQRARNQGMFLGGGAAILGGPDQGLPSGFHNLSSDAAVFDIEYGRWQEEHHRLMCELRAAVQEHLPENELRLYVDSCLAHYDEVLNLKMMVAKSDIFHLVSGMWKTPAERCFMWMGDFRPSELIKIIMGQIEPLTEHQILNICALQQSTQESEEALSQGLEALNQSLSDTITSDSLSSPPNMANYMGQMTLAINKLSTLEGFVRQADNLRHQTVHRLQQMLTTRQAARCLLAIAEYFHRLRALSSLWLARPRLQ
ncbi:bZIP transcription factor TGA10 isoform X2 [Cucumis melo]|uniref:BZIP transcription factor TGA10 isoform X2 n=1 Tax=Cucumis melo TaxID=3656 RepID=A0A1S3B7A0_CUCME|nr:bZIP transcription factor TGA10 isoform X2 [Cucumis melo]